MEIIEKKSYCKINITLNVLGLRTDGYHNLETIIQSIDLYDEISFEKNEEGKIILKSNCMQIPLDETNLIYKGISKTLRYRQIKESDIGITVRIKKNIPIEAGLGGGSSNCATSIKATNEMFKLNLTVEEMIEIGNSIGSDVPFFITEGTGVVEGRGEIVRQIENNMEMYFLLVKPSKGLSTKEIFNKLEIKKLKKRSNIEKVEKSLKEGDYEKLKKSSFNVLQNICEKEIEIIRRIVEELEKGKSLLTLMSGSGSTVFGMYKTEEECVKMEKKILDKFKSNVKTYVVNKI